MDRKPILGKNLFVYFYMCLDVLEKGWIERCKMKGFDRCFLNGAYKCELLVTAQKNRNNQIFPIVWVVVDKKTKHC